jgi:cell division protein FtsB
MFPGQAPLADRVAPYWRRNRGLAVLGGMSAFAVLLLVLSVFGDQGIFRIRRLSRDRALLEEKVAAAERDTEALRRRLGDLRQGRASSELAAREKLGLVKPGEIVYDFRSDPLQQRGAGAAAQAR